MGMLMLLVEWGKRPCCWRTTYGNVYIAVVQ